MINGVQVPLLCPKHAHTTHVKKYQALPPSPSSLAAKSTMGVAEARQGAAHRSERGRRCDPACGRRADQHRLSGDPQADRAVCLCWPQARQGAGRDMAAIRRAVPYLFHWYDTARIACRAGAGREFRQSGGAHLLALAMELQSFRNLPASLQRRRPVPDDRWGLTPRPRGFASGRTPSRIPVAGSVPTFARSRAMPSNSHPCI